MFKAKAGTIFSDIKPVFLLLTNEKVSDVPFFWLGGGLACETRDKQKETE